MTLSAPLSRNFPTLKYVVAPFRWFFRSRRRVLTSAAVLLAMIVSPPLWWCVQLLGLPDIGEPFDVKAFRSFTIPDDRNAFVLYRQAAALLWTNPAPCPLGLQDRWSNLDPACHRWLEQNRRALELYRQGSDRPDALDKTTRLGPDTPHRGWPLMSSNFLALLEASRLEEQGDMAGAWTWYRAVLRATYHQGRYAPVWQRSYFAQSWQPEIRRRLASWSADSRTTPAALRRALGDLIACEEILPSDAYTIKLEYPSLEGMLVAMENSGQSQLLSRLGTIFKSWGIRLAPEQMARLSNAWRSWRRESERSRRVLRLAVANWVAYDELPRGRRPRPAPGVPGPFPFYELGPEAPAGARVVSPAELGRWLASTIDADGLLRTWDLMDLRIVQLHEQASYRAMVVLVASELYRRERGTDPPSDEALVGSYLERLPEDGAGEPPGAAGSAGSGAP